MEADVEADEELRKAELAAGLRTRADRGSTRLIDIAVIRDLWSDEKEDEVKKLVLAEVTGCQSLDFHSDYGGIFVVLSFDDAASAYDVLRCLVKHGIVPEVQINRRNPDWREFRRKCRLAGFAGDVRG